jgi:hypothetical protein
MASIGQLAAGVALEIYNPTGLISSNLKTLGDYTKEIFFLMKKYRNLSEEVKSEGAAEQVLSNCRNMIEEITCIEEKIDLGYLATDAVELIKECRNGTQRIKKIVIDLKNFSGCGILIKNLFIITSQDGIGSISKRARTGIPCVVK